MSAVHVIGHFGNESFRPNGTDKQTQNGLDKTGKMKKALVGDANTARWL